MIYNVAVVSGYVEEALATKLWLNYECEEDLSAREVSKRLYEVLADFVAQDMPDPNKCCRTEKGNFCSKCGTRLAAVDEKEIGIIDGVADLFHTITTKTTDNIHEWSRGDDFLFEYLERQGWDLYGSYVSGPLIEITAFDRYIQDPDSKATEFFKGEIVVKDFWPDKRKHHPRCATHSFVTTDKCGCDGKDR